MTVQVDKRGRRHYLRGLPFSLKDVAKDAGCRWDPDERAWWTGKAAVAEQVAAAAVAGPTTSTTSSQREAPGPNATVAARAKYKGKSYYVAGRVDRGTTHWDDAVDAVTTRDGAKFLLYARDGSFSFWAARDAVQIERSYSRPTTIQGLRAYAERRRREDGKIEEGTYDGRCRGCSGPVVDARHHAAMGGYCGSCAFDEYDC